MEKVIDKIRKLRRHGESARAIGNLREAEAFAARAQELLLQHKLSEEVVDAPEEGFIGLHVPPEEYGQKESRRRVIWSEVLADAVARAHFCALAIVPGSNQYHFVGLRHDLEVAGYVFCVLARTARRLAADEASAARVLYRRYDLTWPGTKKFADSFCVGFVGAISKRYREQRERTDVVQAHALILRRGEEAVTAFLKEIAGGEARPLKVPELDEIAARRGCAAGEAVRLDQAGLGGAPGGSSKGLKF